MFKKSVWLTVMLAIALVAGLGQTAVAAETGSTDWKFHDIVTVDFVKQYVKIPHPEGVTLIDSRPYKPKFIMGHIPTAVSMPFSQFDKMLDKLPKNKSDLLIFYCEGPA